MDRQRFMSRGVAAGTLVALAGMMTGCVNQSEYDSLYESNRSLSSRNQALGDELAASNARVESLEGTTTGAAGAIGSLRSDNQRLRDQLADASQTLLAMEDRLGNMEFGRVDPKTDLALQRFAAAHPNLVTYEADKGMLRFSSDLTFGSGSDNVRAEVQPMLASFAQVLKVAEASAYDIRIVGHTDAEKISSSTAERHPTNMHLSAHRAISVRSILGNQGVAWDRMYACGWGENRPIVANSADGNTPGNRRVEIFLVPSTAGTIASPSHADADDEQAPGRVFDPTK